MLVLAILALVPGSAAYFTGLVSRRRSLLVSSFVVLIECQAFYLNEHSTLITYKASELSGFVS